MPGTISKAHDDIPGHSSTLSNPMRSGVMRQFFTKLKKKTAEIENLKEENEELRYRFKELEILYLNQSKKTKFLLSKRYEHEGILKMMRS